MGVYIKGMEMPHDCDECRLCAFIPVGDYGIHRKCLPLNANAEITIRKADCPLVPIPPHGRLIDADKIGLTNFEIILCQKGNPFKNAIEMLFEKINDAPTIIPAETTEEGI